MTHSKTRTGAFALAITATLAAAGCGSSNDPHGGHDTTAKTTTTATAAPAAGTTTSAAEVDKAFVAQMIPHHEMAIEMAGLAPARGQHPEIKALGRDIVGSQAPEVAQLRMIAERLGVTPAATDTGHAGTDHSAHGSTTTPNAKALGLSGDEMGMSMDMEGLRIARPFDRAFIDEMIPHHQGAIRMARVQLAKGADPGLKTIAAAIVRAQEGEIATMNAWREDWYGAESPAGGVPAA